MTQERLTLERVIAKEKAKEERLLQPSQLRSRLASFIETIGHELGKEISGETIAEEYHHGTDGNHGYYPTSQPVVEHYNVHGFFKLQEPVIITEGDGTNHYNLLYIKADYDQSSAETVALTLSVAKSRQVETLRENFLMSKQLGKRREREGLVMMTVSDTIPLVSYRDGPIDTAYQFTDIARNSIVHELKQLNTFLEYSQAG